MIGHRLWATLGKVHDVYGSTRCDNISRLSSLPGIEEKNAITNLQINDLTHLENVLDDLSPEVLINCIGIVKQRPEAEDPLQSIEINSLLPHKFAEICSKRSIRMIHMSSDCVFDGKTGSYTEKSPTNATDIYGKTKALGEIGDKENVLTIRTSTIGREVFPHGGLLHWIYTQRGKEVRGFSKAIYSGFPTHRLALIFNEYLLPNRDISGILHIASNPIDKYSLLNMIKDHFSLEMKIEKEDSTNIERSLDSSVFNQKFGFKSPSWEELMKDLEVDVEFYNSLQE